MDNDKKKNNIDYEEFERGKKFMDEPPDEELKENMRNERKKFKSRDDSQSERKYRNDRPNKKK